MENIIVRRLCKSGKTFEIVGNSLIKGKSNYTSNRLPTTIEVTDGNICYKMYQSNAFFCTLICLLMPFLYSEAIFPFTIKKAEQKIGYSESFKGDSAKYIHIGNNFYELRSHEDNVVSLMENNIQIALFKKSICTYSEQNQYTVYYRDTDKSKEIIFLLICIYIDSCMLMNIDTKWSMIKYEKIHLIGNDDFKERAEWTPEKDNC